MKGEKRTVAKNIKIFFFVFCFRAYQNLRNRRSQKLSSHESKAKSQSSLRNQIAKKRMQVNPQPRQKRRKMVDLSQPQDHNSNDKFVSTGLDLAATFCHFPKARAPLVRINLTQHSKFKNLCFHDFKLKNISNQKKNILDLN